MKSGTFKPSSTLRIPEIGEQFRNGDFKHDYSPASSSSRQYLFQYRCNSYPQHPNSTQSWKPWRDTKTADYCFGCGEQEHWRWPCPKRKQLTTQDKIKRNTYYNCFIEALNGNYEGEQKTGTAQKIEFSIKDFFSKYDQIRRKLRIWSRLLKKCWKENFIFSTVRGIWRIPHLYSVKDNLKKHLSFWKKTIRANETVYDILQNG